MDKKPVEIILEEWTDDGIPDITVYCVSENHELYQAKRELVNRLAHRYILTARRDGFIDRDTSTIMVGVDDHRSTKYDIIIRVIRSEWESREVLFRKLLSRFIRDCKDHDVFDKDQDVTVLVYHYKRKEINNVAN
jgi:hypothetical protein